MVILQISDIHIDDEGINPEGVDVRGNFKKVIDAVSKEKFNFLVLSGDLCYRDPKPEIYQWIKSQLHIIDQPVYIITGNHDDPILLANYFGLNKSIKNLELYYKINQEGKDIIFLDSGNGTMSEEQYIWLKNTVSQIEKDIFIFMHYPPVIANVPHMDNKWRFKEIDKIQNLLFSFPNNYHIFCGHYHLERTINIYNTTSYITPATFFNLNPEAEYFEIDNYSIGYRKIIISDDKLITTVKYIT